MYEYSDKILNESSSAPSPVIICHQPLDQASYLYAINDQSKSYKHLIWAILSALFCPLLGIIAIIYAVKARKTTGPLSYQYSFQAVRFTGLAFMVGLFMLIVFLVLMFAFPITFRTMFTFHSYS
jgi:hypothetical protein